MLVKKPPVRTDEIITELWDKLEIVHKRHKSQVSEYVLKDIVAALVKEMMHRDPWHKKHPFSIDWQLMFLEIVNKYVLFATRSLGEKLGTQNAKEKMKEKESVG
jgi:hypothetical protein